MKQLLKCGCSAFVLLLTFIGCSKGEEQMLIENVWVVYEMKEHADSAWMNNWEYPTLSFMGKDKYVFQSSSICIIARVRIEKNNKINFESDIGMSFSSLSEAICHNLLVYGINRYDINDYDKLVLTGDNGEKIILNKKNF